MSHEPTERMKGLDLVHTLTLLGIVVFVSFLSITAEEPTSDIKRALTRAEGLALQLKQIRAQNLKKINVTGNLQARSVASVTTPASTAETTTTELLTPFKSAGEIGSDPWGKPYRYETLTHKSGVLLVIWSSGRDGQMNSDGTNLLIAAAEQRPLPYKGDDVGLSMSLDQ